MKRNGFVAGKHWRRVLTHAWLAGLAVWALAAFADCARGWGALWPAACGAAGHWLPPAPGLSALGVTGLVIAGLGGAWLTREARRTRAALRASREYLAMASHELRASANGMLALIELLPRGAFSADERRLLTHAQASGSTLARVLDDMLDYASIEAGQVTLRITRVDVRGWLEGALAPFGARARRKALGFRWRVADEVPARIVTDSDRLRQILVNLLDNAIKYTARGSVSLVVDVREVAQGAVTLVLTVDDTGAGIAGGDLARLFDPFARLGGEAARHTQGAGLGLPIARQLARALGGDVAVTSDARQGTRAEAWIRCGVVGARAARVARVDTGGADEGAAAAAARPHPRSAPASWGEASPGAAGGARLRVVASARAEADPSDASGGMAFGSMASGATACDATTSSAMVSGAAASGATACDATTSSAMVPGAAASGATACDATTSSAMVPGTAASGATACDATTSSAMVPGAAASGATACDATTSSALVPGAAASGATACDATTSSALVPGAAAFGATACDATTSSALVPGTTASGAMTCDAATSSALVPGTAASGATTCGTTTSSAMASSATTSSTEGAMMRRGSGPSSSLRILAVDDHPLNRLALARQLSALGYDSRLCSDGALALAALEAAPFDAVLTDCVMPGMDGVALAAAIGAHPDPRVRATPVIGVTALAARDEVARCIAAGMVVCLDKPTPLDTLRRALADVCAGGGGFDPGRLDSAALLDGIGCVPVRGACRREFLEAFACALEHDRATLEQHLRGVLPGNALRTWCHTARGTFGLFGQRHVDELLDELERRLDGEPDALRTAVGDVFAMIRHLQHRVASAAGERDAIVVSRQQKGE